MAFTDEQLEALVLSTITYRDFGLTGAGWIHGESIHTAVHEGLEDVPLTKDRFDLVWGPVVYRAPLSLVDDAMMYVVRRRDADPPRYVVVVRGTNPISLFDWIFGDLWVTVQMPWPYGGAPSSVKISLSAALGLGLLQSMHSPPPPRDLADELWAALDGGVGSVLRSAGGAIYSRISGALDPALSTLREDIAPFVDRLTAARRARAALLRTNPVAAVAESWDDSLQRSALREVVRIVNALTERYSGLAFAILGATTANPGPGVTLLEFLRAARDEAPGDFEVVVTGHSKGGGLASTVALWLADTQGTQGVPAGDQWDPAGTAKVRCHSFAGPTAGNAAFADHSNAKIGNACARIVNTNDIVPHAWAVDAVKQIPTLWKLDFGDAPITRLVSQVTRDLTTLRLDYTQPTTLADFTVPSPDGMHDFLALFKFHHLDAYFVGLGLRDQLDPIDVIVRP